MYITLRGAYHEAVQKYATNGQYVMQWVAGGSPEEQLIGMSGIEIDDAGFVYVANIYFTW